MQMINQSGCTRGILPRILTIACFAAATSGCSMCCGPYDYHYPTYGGRVQRADPEYGRVGSIFSDAYTAGSGPSADSNITPPKLTNPNNTTSVEPDNWSEGLPVETTENLGQPAQRKSLDEWRSRSTPTNWR